MSTFDNPAHEPWAELAAGYALDALEPEEQVAFELHLDGCEICRLGLHDHAFVAAQLGALAEDADEQAPAWAAIRTGVVGDRPRLVDLAARQRARGNSWTVRALAAAAAAAVLAGAGVALSHVGSNGGTKPGDSAIAACIASTTCQVVRLPDAGREKAAVLVRASSAVVVPTALPTAPSDRVYVLWQMPRSGPPTALATLPELTDGSPSAPHSLKLPYADTAAFAISLEPNDVVPTQPTDVIATGAPTAT